MFYRIRTYDWESGSYTAQYGVPEFVSGLGGLRRAIRLLRECGYTAHRTADDNDSSVLIEQAPHHAGTTDQNHLMR